ncbi:MAG: aspartate kinase [Bdellovibrionales bacterium]|nr:aspartate kinase [Bdellovibrionales bacterium]
MHVLKFGGACLSTTKDIQAIAQKIATRHKQGEKLLVVVSAMGKSTDDLLRLSQQISSHPPLRELDMLLSAGERISMSLMSMALNQLNVPAISFTGSQAGILTKGHHNNAEIFDVRPVRVQAALDENKVVVLAGFQGVDPHTKEVTTLGRGGSDVTAVAMAGHFKAKTCEILKDVDGVYNLDPKLNSKATCFKSLSYQQLKTMCELGCKVLHPRAIALAQELGVNLKIAAAHGENSKGTEVRADTQAKGFALNVLSQVLKVESDHPTKMSNWESYLSFKQIPIPRVLHKTENTLYLTAHSELISYVSQALNDWDACHLKTKIFEAISVTSLSAESDQSMHKKLDSSSKESFDYSGAQIPAKVFLVESSHSVIQSLNI